MESHKNKIRGKRGTRNKFIQLEKTLIKKESNRKKYNRKGVNGAEEIERNEDIKEPIKQYVHVNKNKSTNLLCQNKRQTREKNNIRKNKKREGREEKKKNKKANEEEINKKYNSEEEEKARQSRLEKINSRHERKVDESIFRKNQKIWRVGKYCQNS